MELSPHTQFFGSLVDLDCHIQDLKLILKKTEEIEFSEHDEEDTLIADIHPDITRKSFIVTLLISLDSQLAGFCNLLLKYSDEPLKWNDLKGTALDRFIKYTEKVCGLDSVCDEATKQKVKGLIEVRNCIVHNDSCLENYGKATLIRVFSSQIPGMDLDDDYIELSYQACLECADIISTFMEQAYNSALEKFPSS